jgi:hypothetical protein
MWITVVIHFDFGVGGVIHSPLPPFTLIFFCLFHKKNKQKKTMWRKTVAINNFLNKKLQN